MADRTATTTTKRRRRAKTKFHAVKLISCFHGLGCTNHSCRERVHGVFDPYQAAMFAAQPTKNQGVAACVYGLFGLCAQYRTGVCRYRHYVMVRPLSPQQTADAMRVLMARDPNSTVVRGISPLPVVVWPLYESLKQRGLTVRDMAIPGTATHPIIANQLAVIERLLIARPLALWVTPNGSVYMLPLD